MTLSIAHWVRRLRDYYVARQKDRCAICGLRFEIAGKPHLDDCHNTHHVRGALCPTCNVGLGLFKDSPTLLESAISYLQVDCSKNPPHPQHPPFNPVIGLAPRIFDYAGWFNRQTAS